MTSEDIPRYIRLLDDDGDGRVLVVSPPPTDGGSLDRTFKRFPRFLLLFLLRPLQFGR